MGRLALNQLRAKVVTCDLSMEVSEGDNVHVIHGDHKTTYKCYFTIVKEVE